MIKFIYINECIIQIEKTKSFNIKKYFCLSIISQRKLYYFDNENIKI